MSTYSTRCPTIVEVDDINPLDIRKTSPLLDPLGPVLENIPEHEPTDMPFQQSFREPMDVDDPIDSLSRVQPTSPSSYLSLIVCDSPYTSGSSSCAQKQSGISFNLTEQLQLESHSDHALHGPAALCINFAAANGVDAQSAAFQAPV
ncbi:hypothetical protein B0H13DRAFT_1860706 [Mycena leptocephala]|nr:hypothetical protein B0H13DRAFT_1860706 [Mycena leptocephala]